MHAVIGDDQSEQAGHRLPAIEIVDLVLGMSRSPIDRDRADDSLGDAQWPAHGGVRQAIPTFMRAQRQPRLGDIAVDQQRFAGRHDVAENTGAAREAAANDAGRQIDAGSDFKQVFGPFDAESNGSALCVEARDDVFEDVLLHLQRRRPAGGRLAELIERVNPPVVAQLAGTGAERRRAHRCLGDMDCGTDPARPRPGPRREGPTLILEQYAAVFGPAYSRDARTFGFEPRQLELLPRDDTFLAAHLVGKAAILDEQLAMREHLHDYCLQLGVRPRLAYEPE